MQGCVNFTPELLSALGGVWPCKVIDEIREWLYVLYGIDDK